MPLHHKKKQWRINLLVNIIIPVLILSYFSSPDRLWPIVAFVVALLFPLTFGVYELRKERKRNLFSIIWLVNVLVTGWIGLFQGDVARVVVKETAVPLIFWIVVVGSLRTKTPLITMFLQAALDIEKLKEALVDHHSKTKFDRQMRQATRWLWASFFLSALLNFIVAATVLKHQPWTVEFNQEFARMTALSFPVIAIPMTLMLTAVLVYIFYTIQRDTKLDVMQFVKR